jgi:hypothetical protein
MQINQMHLQGPVAICLATFGAAVGVKWIYEKRLAQGQSLRVQKAS